MESAACLARGGNLTPISGLESNGSLGGDESGGGGGGGEGVRRTLPDEGREHWRCCKEGDSVLVSPVSAPGNMNSSGGGRSEKLIERRLLMVLAGSGGGRWSDSIEKWVKLFGTGSLGGSGAFLGYWCTLLLLVLCGKSEGAGDPLPDSVRFTGRSTDFQFIRPPLFSSSEFPSPSCASSTCMSVLLPNGGWCEEPFTSPASWRRGSTVYARCICGFGLGAGGGGAFTLGSGTLLHRTGGVLLNESSSSLDLLPLSLSTRTESIFLIRVAARGCLKAMGAWGCLKVGEAFSVDKNEFFVPMTGDSAGLLLAGFR